MTQDIVERIRSRIHDAPLPTEYLLDEAGEEIERLRAIIITNDAAALCSHPGFLYSKHRSALPDWAQAALTSSSANISIVGNTPTTGGKLTAGDYTKWLATIPEPIEPANG